jgi:hypothetical protein
VEHLEPQRGEQLGDAGRRLDTAQAEEKPRCEARRGRAREERRDGGGGLGVDLDGVHLVGVELRQEGIERGHPSIIASRTL